MIRIATTDDATAIHAIYAPCVETSAVTFETAVPALDVMRDRLAKGLASYPWLVLEHGGEVLAYAYASRFRERAAYNWACETSVYVREDARRSGHALRLYGRLLDVLTMQGFTRAMSVITLPGEASIELHRKLGFAPAGVWPQVGFKLGAWHDVGVWQCELAAAGSPPRPPTPFAQLAQDARLTALLGKA